MKYFSKKASYYITNHVFSLQGFILLQICFSIHCLSCNPLLRLMRNFGVSPTITLWLRRCKRPFLTGARWDNTRILQQLWSYVVSHKGSYLHTDDTGELTLQSRRWLRHTRLLDDHVLEAWNPHRLHPPGRIVN